MIGVTVDVNSWFKKFSKDAEDTNKKSQRIFREVATKLYTQILDYTPVGNPKLWKSPYIPKGYVPGTLKKSWEINFTPTEITISNPQEYAQRIEDGWSSQAPYGMLKKALVEYPDILNTVSRFKF